MGTRRSRSFDELAPQSVGLRNPLVGNTRWSYPVHGRSGRAAAGLNYSPHYRITRGFDPMIASFLERAQVRETAGHRKAWATKEIEVIRILRHRNP